MVAEPEIGGKAYAVAARGLPVMLAELDELPAIAGQEIRVAGLRQRSAGVRDLAAAVVGHVATDHESERLLRWLARAAVRSGHR